ncbi:guanine nucleotide binding protein, alpha subunit [Mycena floridula]|nr:guanine nucleotide binding protein, alpha subunit [Mycena floridula]
MGVFEAQRKPMGLFEARAERRRQKKVLVAQQKKSDEIDEQLKQERIAVKKQRDLELLVLGQDTAPFIKNFYIFHAVEPWEAQRKAWRAVVRFYLMQNVVELLQKLPELESRYRPLLDQLQPLQKASERWLSPTGYSSDGWISVLEKLDFSEEEETISTCRQDLLAFCQDSSVREQFVASVGNPPGFFLPDAERITAVEYLPTDVDIIRAPFTTPGLSTHCLAGPGNMFGAPFQRRIYDAGGIQSKRVYPYFDDVNAVVFVASLSSFDELATPDSTMTRLDEDYMQWTSICSNIYWRSDITQLCVMLDNRDELQAKLDRGVKIRDHVPDYGDRPNDMENACKYFCDQFKAILKKRDQPHRQRDFYTWSISTVNHSETKLALASLEDALIRTNLVVCTCFF